MNFVQLFSYFLHADIYGCALLYCAESVDCCTFVDWGAIQAAMHPSPAAMHPSPAGDVSCDTFDYQLVASGVVVKNVQWVLCQKVIVIIPATSSREFGVLLQANKHEFLHNVT